MEWEQMYGDKGEVPDGEYTIPIGAADQREGTDVTTFFWKNNKRSP
jgi:pyruvate dehydrogenase E1 component beta subunit